MSVNLHAVGVHSTLIHVQQTITGEESFAMAA